MQRPEDAARDAVTLAGPTDFAGFRAAARRLLAAGVSPDDAVFRTAGDAAPGLFDAPAGAAAADPPPPAAAPGPAAPGAPAPLPPPRLSAEWLATLEQAALHDDPTRWARLYRFLWRLQRTPALRDDAADPEAVALQQMAQAVRREQHKMKAFVRFREVERSGTDPATGRPWGPLHVAWFEPRHHVVDAVAPFFMRRFAGMHWVILTPRRSVRWDGTDLHFGPGARPEDAPPADAGERLWLTYYESIFNPARLKLAAMEKEMPRRYWVNLPEAVLISRLSADAATRAGGMVQAAPTTPAPRLPAPPPRPADARVAIAADPATWAGQRAAAAGCRACPLGALATQTVWGEGPVGAALMLVGEQPGDHEDLQGRPFVGPAGQLLDRALAQLGIDRAKVYVTNAVKHFKYEPRLTPRGKRRIHKTPAQQEADACLHWLEAEIETVAPQALVALGATAARQLLGRPVAVTRERGRWLPRAGDGRPVLVTLHPSALLRMDPAARDAAFEAWLADLRRVQTQLDAAALAEGADR